MLIENCFYHVKLFYFPILCITPVKILGGNISYGFYREAVHIWTLRYNFSSV